jgi:hypothetical protein
MAGGSTVRAFKAFLTTAIDGNVSSLWRSGFFVPRKETPVCTEYEARWALEMPMRSGESENSLPLPGILLEFLCHHSLHTITIETYRLLACYMNYSNYYIIMTEVRMTFRNVALLFI